MTFPYMPCSWLSLDTMDISGDLHLDVVSLRKGRGSGVAMGPSHACSDPDDGDHRCGLPLSAGPRRIQAEAVGGGCPREGGGEA